MGISHVLRFVLAGRRCVHRRWHGELLNVHHHRQYSWFCACSCSKLPIASMGFSHVCACLSLQGGAVNINGGTVTFSWCTITGNTATNVRAHAQKFPSPRWEFLLTCPIDSHLSIRIDIWFYQANVRASHACRLPIAPMVKWLTWLPRLSLAQLRLTLLSTTVGMRRRGL